MNTIIAAMKPQHIVSIILVITAVLVVAAFLIVIIIELRRTYMRLITILGAVGETVDRTDGLETVVAGIARDLAEGQKALADSVDRLEQRLGGGASNGSAGDSAGVSKPPPAGRGDVFTNY
jgi:hypothetical protein